MNLYSLITTPIQIDNQQCQVEFEQVSQEAHRICHDLKFLKFLKKRQKLETSVYSHTDKLETAEPVDALISVKIEQFMENHWRFFLSTYESRTPFILSNYFDKAVIDVGSQHFEWTRNVDSLETDGLEFVLDNPPNPLSVSCTIYPDFPLPYYSIPDEIASITERNIDCIPRLIKAINHYAALNQLIENGTFKCDAPLQSALGFDSFPIGQLPTILKSRLLPLAPIRINCFLETSKPRFNVKVKLPNFASFPQFEQTFFSSESSSTLSKLAQEYEKVSLMAAIHRNPFEAIEAEVAGHATHCEISESNSANPQESIDPIYAARRSTQFYWQPWVPEYAPRFLEENKQVHNRYPQKPSTKKK